MNMTSNQRLQERIYLNEPVQYKKEVQGPVYNAKIFNFSRGGMGLISDVSFLPETSLYIHQGRMEHSVLQEAKVIWSQKMPQFDENHPRYQFGIKFISI